MAFRCVEHSSKHNCKRAVGARPLYHLALGRLQGTLTDIHVSYTWAYPGALGDNGRI